MALTEVYIGTGGNDSNDGKSHANRKLTFNNGSNDGLFDEAQMPSSGGLRVNVNDEGAITLTEAFDLTATFLDSNSIGGNNQLVCQGYTSAAGDNGIGDVDGDDSFSIISAASQNFFMFRKMHLHNVGDREILFLATGCSLINCEIDTCSKSGNATDFNQRVAVYGCHFHDLNGTALHFSTGNVYRSRFIDGASVKFSLAINCDSVFCNIMENIIWLNSTGGTGIKYDGAGFVCANAVFNNTAGTADGIKSRQSGTAVGTVLNNLVEGFSGTGGVGISAPSAAAMAASFGNAVHNCTTKYENTGNSNILARWDEEELSASPFTDAANKDFSPVDTGGVKEGSQPTKIGLFDATA